MATNLSIDPKLLDQVIAQIDKMITKVVKKDLLSDVDAVVPESYRPLVDQYFRNLSDDMKIKAKPSQR